MLPGDKTECIYTKDISEDSVLPIVIIEKKGTKCKMLLSDQYCGKNAEK